MAWQDVLPLSVTRIDAEQERELRLAAQARAGADWALAALVARYQPPVTRYLTRLTGDADLARTLAEHIFLRMDRRLRGPHGGHQLRLWLLRSCTEAGLDAVRRPRRAAPARLESPQTAGLLAGRVGEGAAGRLRAGWEAIAEATGTTRRQVRKLIWSTHPEDGAAARMAREHDTSSAPEDEPFLSQDPLEALRFRLMRAVLAELPYGDAQCLALHLVAGLNQAEVARALGITQSATRRRIVHGLQLFSQRYEAAAASLGLPVEPAIEDAGAISIAVEPGRDVIVPAGELPTFVQREDAGAEAIWSGAYSEQDLRTRVTPTPEGPLVAMSYEGPTDLTDLPIVVDAVVESSVAEAQHVAETVPVFMSPVVEDRMIAVEPEVLRAATETLLTLEATSPAVAGEALAGDVGPVAEARVVPVLTASVVLASEGASRVIEAATASVVSGSAETSEEAPLRQARLVPVLTPGSQQAAASATLRALVQNGALGAFGAPNGPTVPLPGREGRRAALSMILPAETHPEAG